jgi:hypothetical protein
MKKMILAKILNFILLAVSVEIMVSLLAPMLVDEADKAVAHRQCARNADALKPGDGNYILVWL